MLFKNMKHIRALFIVLILFLGLVTKIFPEDRGDDFDPAPYLGTRWYGVYLMENKVGYGYFRLTPSTYHGTPSFTIEFFISYRLNLGGSTQEMSIREEKIYLPGEGLTSFVSTNNSILGKSSFVGKKVNGQFEVTTPTGEKTIPAAGESLYQALADLILVRSRAQAGTTIETSQIEIALLKSVRIIHTVESIEKRTLGGVSTEIYRIKSEFPDLGISTISFIDENLHTLEAKISILTIREEEEDAAKNMGYVSDLLLSTSIHPARPVPDPRNASSLTLKLSGITDPELIIPSSRQEFTRLDSQTYYLKINTRNQDSILPRKIPILDPALKDYLKATAYIQSNHPSIRILAKEIAGSKKDGLWISERLMEWVYKNLDKSFLAAIPNAVDVLKRRSGDCKAHAVLFTALARSLGLPARLVSGLVATDDGAFYYHQWAEVYTGQWIPVDPVFGTVPVDATHIKLSQGDLSEQMRLLNAIGNISIEVLDYETDSKKE